MTTIRLSKSSINTFQQCPEKFKYTTILKEEDPAGPEAALGRQLHAIYDEYYDTLPEKIDEQTIFDHALRYDNGSYTEHLEHFAAFNITRWKGLKDKSLFKPKMKEFKFWNEKLNLSGLLDAVYVNDDGTTTVIDFKTGNYKSDHLLEYRDELSIYNELLLRETKIIPTHWGIYFSKTGHLWREPVQTDHFKNIIIPRINEIQSAAINDEFPPKTGILCLYCSRKSRCSAFGGENTKY